MDRRLLLHRTKLVFRRLLAGLVGLIARQLTPDARFKLLNDMGKAILPQYRFKWPAMDWWDDKHFNRYLDRFGELYMPNTDRRLMVWELLRLVHDVPGDTAECGVFMGAASYAICAGNALSPHRRTHHLFDSFEGLSAPGGIDGAAWNVGDLASGIEDVRRNLAEFGDRVRFYKGWIPSRFNEVAGLSFSFVHVDVDLYAPTLESLEFFYPRLAPGAVLVCDDYGTSWCPGATQACDEFLANKTEKMIRLDAGGGFLIKGTRTGPRDLIHREEEGVGQRGRTGLTAPA
jgi:hypothetical protein